MTWIGWAGLFCPALRGKDWMKNNNIFTTKAALIMPGPHRGPFCLLTWATINTSSIQYNSACSLSSIIKSLDGLLLVWDWFDKQTKHKSSVKTCWCWHFWSILIQLVGMAYSSLQLDILLPLLGTGIVACFVWHLGQTVMHYWTEQQRLSEMHQLSRTQCPRPWHVWPLVT